MREMLMTLIQGLQYVTLGVAVFAVFFAFWIVVDHRKRIKRAQRPPLQILFDDDEP